MSQTLKSRDPLSISHVLPDWYAGIRPCWAAFRSVERSMPYSTLNSLIVFMWLYLVEMVTIGVQVFNQFRLTIEIVGFDICSSLLTVMKRAASRDNFIVLIGLDCIHIAT